MKLNPALAEVFPAQNLEPTAPRLLLIQGDGEPAEYPAGYVPYPDLYVVPDAAGIAAAETESEAGSEEGGGLMLLDSQVTRVATRAGRIIGGSNLKFGESEPTGESEARRHKGGSGGWAIREHLKKLAAEEHESECGGCSICEGHQSGPK